MDRTHRNSIAAIIITALLAYGTQIPWLGFFQDDWNFVFYSSVRGVQGLWEYLVQDGRPGATWVYALGFGLLGFEPPLWQFFSLLLRVLTTILFWIILNELWPQRAYGNLIGSIFFLLYPFYVLQPQAITYAMHWMAYLLFAISIFLMMRAIQKPEKSLRYLIPALLCTATHLFTIEYFVGLEILRPFLLWFLFFRRETLSLAMALKKVFMAWLPYLLILVLFVAWRSVVLAGLAAQNDPLAAVFDLGVMLSVVRNILADWVLMFISSWFNLIDPIRFVVGPIRNAYLFAFILFGAGCFYILLKQIGRLDSEEKGLRDVFLAGILLFATGMISAYSIGYIVHLKTAPWNSRFALPALPGLALMASGLIEVIVTSPHRRHFVSAVLVGLLIGWHNYNTFNFKSAWEKQTRLYEQLIWRAPSIQPGTAIIANEEILGYMGDYPTSFAFNTMYEAEEFENVPVWFFAFSANYDSGVSQAVGGDELAARQATTTFRGKKQDALLITYEPENNQCLWVLRPEDTDFKNLPERMKEAARSSSVQSIRPLETGHILFHRIVGENKDTWCYFYEKADLARQRGDWNKVWTLWKEAEGKSYRPGNGFEYIPFIEASAHLRNWEDALQLTRNAKQATKAMYFILCPTWSRLVRETPDSEEKTFHAERAKDLLECTPG